MEALAERTAARRHELELLRRLDSLGQRNQVEAAADLDDPRDEPVREVIGGNAADERAVHLERLDPADVPQAPERGVAGAEIVDRHRDAAGAQALHHLAHPGQLRHRRGLGDLHHEGARGKPLVLDGAGDALDDVGVAHLAEREVDRSRDAEAPALPGRELAAGLVDHPLADPLDDAGLLGERDEVARGHQPALGTAPAHQRLDPRAGSRLEIDDRLVVELQLVAIDRAEQVRRQREGGRPVAGDLR